MDNEVLKVIFSKNLNYWLEKRNKTQADLYKRLGVSSATASDWCNEKKIPRTDKLVDIAGWLMIELSDLLYDKEHIENEEDYILFRLKDDNDFRLLVEKISNLNNDNVTRLIDYVDLLSK